MMASLQPVDFGIVPTTPDRVTMITAKPGTGATERWQSTVCAEVSYLCAIYGVRSNLLVAARNGPGARRSMAVIDHAA